MGLIVGAFALWYVFIHKPLPDEQGAKKELTPAPSAQIAPPEQVPVSALPPQLTREQVDHIAELLDKAHLNHNQRRWAACNAAYQAVMDQYAPAVVDNPVEAEMADLCQQITFSAK